MSLEYDIELVVEEVQEGKRVEIGKITDHWHLSKTSSADELATDIREALEGGMISVEKFAQAFNSGSDVMARAAFKSKFHAKSGTRTKTKEEAEKFNKIVAAARKAKSEGNSTAWDMLTTMGLV